MSAFHDACQATLLLHCPWCHEQNRPGIVSLELDDDCKTVFCTVCGKDGPLVLFLPPTEPVDPVHTL
jgi:hypothetical protein